ncbi:MAG TPA: hypothetical protein VM029_00715 [Opitutaceae bacterium]|nr:hypothetical protein [Opitutaceae bacterium]
MTSSPLRKAGLGRLAYRFYYAPLGAVRASFAAGGPLEQWRTARGREAMERAARNVLPPLPPPPGDAPAPPVHVLTGRALWYQTAFMLHSLARFQPVQVVVHDDGTLAGAPCEALQRIIPWATFLPAAEAESRLDRVLPPARYPFLRARRSELVLFRKIMDVHAGVAGWRLFLDSDMIFFREPKRLMKWLRAPDCAMHMVDVERAYGYDLELLNQLAGRSVPDLVNTGMLGLRSEAIDWDYLERSCGAMIERAGTHYYQEQALVALHLATQPHATFPREDYLVRPEPPETQSCRAVMHHYVAGSKRWYFRESWRRVFEPVG